MKIQKVLPRSLLAVIVCLQFANSSAEAAGVNNVYYSSAMCSPTQFNEGRTDLEFNISEAIGSDSGSSIGGWYNTDRSNVERLVCPIPYDKFNTKGHLVVRAVVRDNNNDTDGRIRVTLCGQPAQGPTFCHNTTGTASTSAGGTGTSTLTVSVMPNSGQSSQDPLRWFWISVDVPHFDSSRPSGSRVSGIMGYRVLRCGGPTNQPDCGDVN